MKTTVIISTVMDAPDELAYILDKLTNQNCKIKLIDNSPNGLCSIFESVPNVTIDRYPENIGTNQSWNAGIKKTETENYILLNDRCIVWNNLISTVETILLNPDIGIVTFETLVEISNLIYDSLFKNRNTAPQIDELISYTGWDGGLIAGKTADYRDIPSHLKPWQTSDWVFDLVKKTGKKITIDRNNFVLYAAPIYNENEKIRMEPAPQPIEVSATRVPSKIRGPGISGLRPRSVPAHIKRISRYPDTTHR